MAVSTIFPPIYPNNVKIDVGQWNGTTVTFVDVSPWVDRTTLDLEWHLDSYTAQGRFTITIPIAQDTYDLDVWNEVRIYDPNGAATSGGTGAHQDRYFRGFIMRLESETTNLVKTYRVTLVDGNVLFDKMTKPFVLPAATYTGTDLQIIHAINAYCLPELYPSGIYAAPSNPSTAPTLSASGAGSALVAGQYIIGYTWTNMGGETMISPKSTITITAGQNIVIDPPAFPTNVSGVKFYAQPPSNIVNFMQYVASSTTANPYTLTVAGLGAPPPLANSTTPYPINPSVDQTQMGGSYYSNLTVTIGTSTYREALVELQKQIALQVVGTVVPRFFMMWNTDPGSHAWSWQVVWTRDTDQAIDTIILTDQAVEDATHAHYYAYTRVRDGSQLINDQWAVGVLADGTPVAQHTQSSVSYNAIGRYVSGKPIVSQDPPANTAAVLNLSRAELDKWKYVLETISGVLTFVPYALRGFPRVSFRCQTEGGLDIDPVAYPTATNPANLPVYVISRMELTWNGDGVLEYKMDLGTSFPELGEKGAGWRGGAITTRDKVAPAAPVWHNTDALDFAQSYQLASRDVALTAMWIANTEGDFGWYQVRYWVGADTTPRYSGQIFQASAPQFTITAPISTTVTFQLASFDAHGNTLGWVGPNRSIVTIARPVPPTPASVQFTSLGQEGWGIGYGNVVWTSTTLAGQQSPVYWNLQWWPTTGTAIYGTLPHVTALNARIHGLTIGQNYFLQVQSVAADGTESAWSTAITINVPAEGPYPPRSMGLNQVGRALDGTWWLQLTWVAPLGPDPGHLGTANQYEIEVSWVDSALGTRYQYYQTQNIGQTLYTVPALSSGVAYTFRMRSITGSGIAGAWTDTTNDLNYTITAILADELPNGGFEVPSLTDSTKPDKWSEHPTSGGTTHSWGLSTAQRFAGSKCVQMTWGNFSTQRIYSDPFAIRGGTRYAISGAYYPQAAGSSQSPYMGIFFYDSTGAEIDWFTPLGLTNEWGSNIQNNPFPNQWNFIRGAGGGVLAPTNAVTMRLGFGFGNTAQSTGGITYTVYLDSWEVVGEIGAPNVSDGAITLAKIDSTNLAVPQRVGGAYPSTASQGDVATRSDSSTLNLYNAGIGAWTAPSPIIIPFMRRNSLPPLAQGVIDTSYILPLPGGVGWYVIEYGLTFYLGVLNNASNYWNIALFNQASTQQGAGTNTIGKGGSWQTLRVATSLNYAADANTMLYLQFVSTGSPGNIEPYPYIKAFMKIT